MDNKCLLCDRISSMRNLKSFDDNDLNICDKINEIFNVKLNEHDLLSKFMICQKCIKDLNTSYEFYNCVQRVKEILLKNHTNDVMIKVEVKQEVAENFEDFSLFDNYNYGDSDGGDNESIKDETTEENVVKKKRGRKKVHVEKEKPQRKYRKLTPEMRKKNRGIRRAKESLKITTTDLYKNELNDIYSDTPELLQILAEDKLPNGRVSDRIVQLFQSTSWSNYKWICDKCGESFPDIVQLSDHLHKNHRIRYKRSCQDCHKTTHHQAAFINHVIEKHVQQNKFCCILCSQLRWNLKDLFFHYQDDHSAQTIAFCIYCGLHFIGGAKLKEHLINKHKRDNEEGGMFECDLCGCTTDMRHKMKQHMIKHTSQTTFMCDQCTVTFATSSYLSTHIKQVHSRLELSCGKCDKLFKSERRLRVHDRAVHQDNKQYLCHICHKAFHAQYRLNSHLRIHADAMEERHQCPYCERKFKYKPGMIYHIRAAHTGETPYSCPMEGCNERFYDYSNARKHISGAHNSTMKPLKE